MWISPWGSLQHGSWLLTEGGTDRHRHGHRERESSAMTLYHLCCFLARIKSLWPVFTQGETSHRTWIREDGDHWGHLRDCLSWIKGKLLPRNSSPQWNATCYLFLASFKKKFASSVSSFFNVYYLFIHMYIQLYLELTLIHRFGIYKLSAWRDLCTYSHNLEGCY